MEKWKCTVCGYVHEGPMTPDFKCAKCRQGADKFVKIEEDPKKKVLAKTVAQLWESYSASELPIRGKSTSRRRGGAARSTDVRWQSRSVILRLM